MKNSIERENETSANVKFRISNIMDACYFESPFCLRKVMAMLALANFRFHVIDVCNSALDFALEQVMFDCGITSMSFWFHI